MDDYAKTPAPGTGPFKSPFGQIPGILQETDPVEACNIAIAALKAINAIDTSPFARVAGLKVALAALEGAQQAQTQAQMIANILTSTSKK